MIIEIYVKKLWFPAQFYSGPLSRADTNLCARYSDVPLHSALPLSSFDITNFRYDIDIYRYRIYVIKYFEACKFWSLFNIRGLCEDGYLNSDSESYYNVFYVAEIVLEGKCLFPFYWWINHVIVSLGCDGWVCFRYGNIKLLFLIIMKLWLIRSLFSPVLIKVYTIKMAAILKIPLYKSYIEKSFSK